jgi:hypothetical protein
MAAHSPMILVEPCDSIETAGVGKSEQLVKQGPSVLSRQALRLTPCVAGPLVLFADLTTNNSIQNFARTRYITVALDNWNAGDTQHKSSMCHVALALTLAMPLSKRASTRPSSQLQYMASCQVVYVRVPWYVPHDKEVLGSQQHRPG